MNPNLNRTCRVVWHTRGATFDKRIKHEGHMIAILSAVVVSEDTVLADRAVIIETDPPGELPGTRFKVVDLTDLSIIEW